MIKGIIFGLDDVLVDSAQGSDCYPEREKYEMLMKLKACEVRMAVCSNAFRQTVDVKLLKSQLKNFFEFTLSRDEVRTSEPSPDVYRHASNLMGLDPSDCVVFESREENVSAAKASGAYVIKVNSAEEISSELISEFFEIQRIADGVIDVLESLSELADKYAAGEAQH